MQKYRKYLKYLKYTLQYSKNKTNSYLCSILVVIFTKMWIYMNIP